METTHIIPVTLDERLRHVEQYAYKPHDATVNAPLIGHMAVKHPERYAKWVADDTIGDLEDEHYMAHGLLVSNADLLAALHAEKTRRSP